MPKTFRFRILWYYLLRSSSTISKSNIFFSSNNYLSVAILPNDGYSKLRCWCLVFRLYAYAYNTRSLSLLEDLASSLFWHDFRVPNVPVHPFLFLRYLSRSIANIQRLNVPNRTIINYSVPSFLVQLYYLIQIYPTISLSSILFLQYVLFTPVEEWSDEPDVCFHSDLLQINVDTYLYGSMTIYHRWEPDLNSSIWTWIPSWFGVEHYLKLFSIYTSRHLVEICNSKPNLILVVPAFWV